VAYPGSRAHAFVDGEELVFGVLNNWAPPNVGWGNAVQPKTSAVDQSGIAATMTDITFATASWTSVNGRWYEVVCSVELDQITTAGIQTLVLQTGTTGTGTRRRWRFDGQHGRRRRNRPWERCRLHLGRWRH
jgi:hypothetical protein